MTVYTLYKTRNVVNGKIYVGLHKTDDPNDSYLGSGKALKGAIDKYGADAFEKTVIGTWSSLEEAREAERRIVDEDFVARSDTYNIALGGGLGGEGLNGFTFRGRTHSADAKQKIGTATQARGCVLTDDQRAAIGERNRTNEDRKRKISATTTGRIKTAAHRKKISEAAIANGSGTWNRGKPKPKVTCPHCGKVGSPNNMVRWHFDNCKHVGK